MILHLDDLITIVEVKQLLLPAKIPLEEGQRALLSWVYGTMVWHTGQQTSVRRIEQELADVSTPAAANLARADYFCSQDLQLLSLRKLNSAAGRPSRQELAQRKKSEILQMAARIHPPENCYIYLAREAEDRLYLGVGSIILAGPNLDFEGRKFLEMSYRLESLKLTG